MKGHTSLRMTYDYSRASRGGGSDVTVGLFFFFNGIKAEKGTKECRQLASLVTTWCVIKLLREGGREGRGEKEEEWPRSPASYT